jgi:dGTPase
MGCVAVDGPWLLEIQVVDIADQIAYDNHDLDDGIKSGLLNERDMRGIELWEDALGAIAKTFCALGPELERTQMIRYLINEQVSDVLEATRANIAGQGIKTVKDLESNDNRVVDFSSRMNKKRGPLRHVLMEKLYKNHRVVSMSMKAARFLKSLFEVYCENTKQLSPQVQERIEERGKHRAICDYIAGMTDRYALDQYKKIFEPYERV